MVWQSVAQRQLHRPGYGQEQSEDVSRGSDCDEAEASGTDHLVTDYVEDPLERGRTPSLGRVKAPLPCGDNYGEQHAKDMGTQL